MEIDAGSFLYITAKLFTGALAAVFAIIIWSKTREAAWIFIVLGIISLYMETIYLILERLGLNSNFPLVDGIDVVKVTLGSLHFLFFTIAFISILARRAGFR